MKQEEKKKIGKEVNKNYKEDIEIDETDFLEYDAPYKDDPYKEKDVIIS